MQTYIRDPTLIPTDPKGSITGYQSQRLPAYPQQVFFSQPPQYQPSPQFNQSHSLHPSMAYQSQPPIIYQSKPFYPFAMQQPSQFLVNTHPILWKPQQQSDYPSSEQVKSLCEGKITQANIHCVLCSMDYKISEKQQHLQKHLRKIQSNNLYPLKKPQKLQSSLRPSYIIKPIVEPQEAIAQYDPNVYKIIQQIIYQDEVSVNRHEALVGPDPSFNFFDNNASLSLGNELIIKEFQSQPNPFFKKDLNHVQQHQYDYSMPSGPARPLLEQLKQHEEKEHASALSQIHGNTINQYPAGGFESGHHAQAFALKPIKQNSFANIQQDPIIKVYPSPEVQNQAQIGHISKRFQETQKFKGFPEEQMRLIQQKQYSGPHQILPSNEQSKKSTEVNMSQFIRDLHLQPESSDLQERNKQPYQSQW